MHRRALLILLAACSSAKTQPAPPPESPDSDRAIVTNGGGCYPTDATDRSLAQIVLVNPEWAPVGMAQAVVSDPVLVHGKVVWIHGDTGGDFPGTHASSDYNVGLDPDPEDRFRLATGNLSDKKPILELEWEAKLVPPWAWAGEGDREVALGRWIFDCGHPDLKPRTCTDGKGTTCTADSDCTLPARCDRQHYGYTTEIHPPYASAVIREGRGGQLTSDLSAPGVPVTKADVWINPNGGAAGDACVVTHQKDDSDIVFNQDCYPLSAPLAKINAQDFTFTMPLPDRPSPAAKAIWFQVTHDGAGSQPANVDIIAHESAVPPSIEVRVLLTRAVNGMLPTGFARTILAGWTMPPPTPLQHVRVTVDQVQVIDALHPAQPVVREVKHWHLQVAMNGEWQGIDLEGVESGMTFDQALTFDQWLPASGEVRIVANGTSRACIDTLFGTSLKASLAELGFNDMVSCLETSAQDPGEIDVTYPGPGFGAGAGEMRYESMTKAFVLKYRVTLVP